MGNKMTVDLPFTPEDVRNGMTALAKPPTRETMDALKRAASEAKAAYHAHQSDGTVEGDLENRRLLKATARAGEAYEQALDAYLRAEGVVK